jgi:hypothetical protein
MSNSCRSTDVACACSDLIVSFIARLRAGKVRRIVLRQ